MPTLPLPALGAAGVGADAARRGSRPKRRDPRLGPTGPGQWSTARVRRSTATGPRPTVPGVRFPGYVSRYPGRAPRRLFYVVIKKRPVGYPQAKCLIRGVYGLPWSRVVIHNSGRYARCRTIGKKNPARWRGCGARPVVRSESVPFDNERGLNPARRQKYPTA